MFLIIYFWVYTINIINFTDGVDGFLGVNALTFFTSIFLYFEFINNKGFIYYTSLIMIPLLLAYLCFNKPHAKVFMGDTGSLALGGIIAVFAISIRKELLIPVLCGIFLIENLSVLIQVGYFKFSKRRFGEGRRVFLMAPLHHHYQKKGMHEAKIVSRFWIVAVLLAVISIVTLKLR